MTNTETILSDASGADRRRAGRVRAIRPILLQVAMVPCNGGLSWHSAELVDYSDVGFGIEIDIAVLRGSLLLVRGPTPDYDGNAFVITAEVRWTQPTNTGKSRAGLLLDSSYHHALVAIPLTPRPARPKAVTSPAPQEVDG